MNGKLKPFKHVVVKIGSSLLIDADSNLRRDWLRTLAEDLAVIHRRGSRVMVVSSGAIALGRGRIKEFNPALASASLRLKESQAAAAIGQIALSGAFEKALSEFGLNVAQILLTIGDTEERRRYLNARATIGTLLKWGIVPIINENDTVATTEIRYGDNDRLAARVASMMDADLLVLLSDVEGLYSAPPANDASAKLLTDVGEITPEIESMAGDAGSALSRGGMKTKIEAAKIATEAGVTMVIASGRHDHALRRIDQGRPCTWFSSSPVGRNSRNARKKWIAGGLNVKGTVVIDNGALLALESGKSLLPAGVVSADGEFRRGDTISIVGPHGHVIGRGLVEYDFADAQAILGLKSRRYRDTAGEQHSNGIGPSRQSGFGTIEEWCERTG